MNTLLVNLDFYDDSGTLLRSLIPNPSNIPEFVKTAHVMTGKEDSDLYALVLKDESGFHKKFPTYDIGNTWVSSSYFSENYEKLTKEAQVTAASNLKTACKAFGIPVLDIIEKLASDVTTNVVDVEGKRPLPSIKKVASEYALKGRYPLNSASDVKQATLYFEDYHTRFEPEDRREFAVKVASVASKYGLPTSEKIELYSSSKTNQNVAEHLHHRSYLLNMEPEDHSDAIWTLGELSKVAHTIEADVLAQAITQFDKKHGLNRYWGKDILDPYASVLEKKASGFTPGAEVITIGPLTVTVTALEHLVMHRKLLVDQFGDEFANEYSKDPVNVFKSMPTPQKTIIINLANSQAGY